MSSSVICGACGTRLKLPPEFTKRKAKCPKCNARVDVTAALNASAYLPTVTNESIQRAESQQTTTPEREEDPLPYPSLNPAAPSPVPPSQPTKPTKPKKNAPLQLPITKQSEPLSLDDPPLPLDDEPASAEPPLELAGPAPFRVPVYVSEDSADQFIGPCEAVFVSHGLFFETVPFRPFLYIPIRSQVAFASRCGLQATLPDGRRIAFEFTGRNAQQLTNDTTLFLAGERGVPNPGDYRSSTWWMLALAFMLAAGLAAGPIVMCQTANLGLDFGLKVGLAFAGIGLLANAAVVLLTKMSISGKIAAMTSVGVLVTGIFLFGAAAYLTGRKDAAEQSKTEPPTQSPPPKPSDQAIESPPEPHTHRPATAIDTAYRDGLYRFEDGPDEVTALSVGTDWSALVIGYKNGTTRIWRFDQSTIDPSAFDPGPKSDGPPTNIQFDSTGTIIYMTCTGGTVAALWNAPPEVPMKIPGDSIAVLAAPDGERFAALRGNALIIRKVPTSMIQNPASAPKKATTAAKTKGFLVTTAADEKIPNDVKGPLTLPQGRLTFLAWHPTGKLLGGMPDGSIVSWSGPNSIVVTREHKGAVRAWAASPTTWDFATGDDKGMIGIWANKSLAPKTFYASASAAITQLSFSPSGTHLAAKDAEGTISVWDLSAQRAVLKIRRPAAKAITFGPNDDLLLLSNDKAVELWWIPELDRRP